MENHLAARGLPLRILVVDDNPDATDSLARLLKYVGHEARVAYRGKEALEEALELLPDVVFLDLMMPGYSGYELVGPLRELNAVLVAVTGLRLSEVEGCHRFDYVLSKPAKLDTLTTLLDEISTHGSAKYANRLMHQPALWPSGFIRD